MVKKRIIQLPEALEYADDAVIAIDDAVNGTQKLPLSDVFSYDMSTATAGFADRAVNTVTMNGNLTMTLPTQVAGKVRDFVVTLTVTAAGALTVTGLDHYYYDAGADDPITTAFEAGKTYQLYFTEAASGVFRVGRTELVYK